MKRIRALGLGVVMALALTAVVGVSSASAVNYGFKAEAYPAIVSGGAGGGSHVLGFNSLSPTCDAPTFSMQVNSGPAASWTTSSNEGASCKWASFTPWLTMNGCQFSFHPGAPETTGTMSIGPEGCGPISLTAGACTVTIGAQSGLKAKYGNGGSGKKSTVLIEAQITNLKYTESKTCSGGGGTYTGGSWKGLWAMSATANGGIEYNGISIVPLKDGLFLTGKESGEEASQPKLEAESYPAEIIGTQDPTKKLTFGFNFGTARCNTLALTGSLTSSTTSLPLGAKGESCVAFGIINAVVTMNSCKYVVEVANAGPPYAGTFGVSCAKEGDVIEINGFVCTATIGSQSGLAGLSLSNTGSGEERRVTVNAAVSGIKYTEQGGFCKTKTSTNGTLSGIVTLEGFDA